MTDVKELTKGIRNCECGRDHNCLIDFVEIGNNVLPKIAQFSEGFCKILLVADQNTYAAGRLW